MINKQSLWFLTLFSLILVLSVYYITMPNELLLTNNSNYLESKNTSKEEDSDTKVTIEESELLVTMRVNLEEERSEQIADLKTTLTSSDATSEEKNNAYEKIKYITDLKGQEEAIEEKIKKEYNLESFVKIDNNEVKVVAVKDKHDSTLANKIMKTVHSEFQNTVGRVIYPSGKMLDKPILPQGFLFCLVGNNLDVPGQHDTVTFHVILIGLKSRKYSPGNIRLSRFRR